MVRVRCPLMLRNALILVLIKAKIDSKYINHDSERNDIINVINNIINDISI